MSKSILELVGALVAAATSAWILRNVFCWASWNFGWLFISMNLLNVVALLVVFLTTLIRSVRN